MRQVGPCRAVPGPRGLPGVPRAPEPCPCPHSLFGGSDYKLIYRHYATLYFVFCVDSSESELGILDLIQVCPCRARLPFPDTVQGCFMPVASLCQPF